MTGPPPYQPKPSIVDRVLARLYPETQNFPEIAGQTRSQLAANLLVAGGASPYQRGTLANIGAAIGGVDTNALVQNALQLQAYQRQVSAQQQIGQIMAENAPKPGETREETYNRLLKITAALPGIPGAEKLLGDLSNVLAQIKPAARKTVTRPAYVDPRTGLVTLDPSHGVAAIVTFDAETGEQVGPARGAAPQTSGAGGIHPYSTGPGEPIVNISLGPNGQPIATPVTVAGQGPGSGQTLRKLTLNPQERDAAARAKDALGTFIDLFGKDESAAVNPVGAAALEGMGHLPLVGGAVAGLTGPAAQKQRTDNQQAFQRAAVQLRHNAAALSPHARLQLGFLEDINKAYVPPAGTSSQTIREQYLPEWIKLRDQMNQLLGNDVQSAAIPQHPRNPFRVQQP